MAHFAKVARLADLPPGTGMMVVGPFDKPMALFNVGGEVFAINAVGPIIRADTAWPHTR
jgi:nitrite reductase/ring-hydroxylating ferredoxin subunit